MAKRHRDALAIQQGACNPSGITIAITEACREIRAEPDYRGTDQITSDPAVRLMVHQLAFLTKVRQIDDELSEYHRLDQACRDAS